MEIQIDSVLVPKLKRYCIPQSQIVKLFNEGYSIDQLVGMAHGSRLFKTKQFSRDYVCNAIRKSMLSQKEGV